MLIHRATQKVVLNLSNPARVTTVIPTAKAFVYKGATLVAVPHRLPETRILRNLGFDVPAPMTYHYDWPGLYQPFHAQRETAAFLTLNPRAFCLNDMGTGKTLATLWAYDYLRRMGLVEKALIISPLSTLERAWADEVFRHFPELRVNVIYGDKARRQKLLAADADIYLINHDGVKVMQPELMERKDIGLVVIDEVAAFRNANTARWKALRDVCAGRPWLWGLTGTPTPNLPTDAWAQCRLISPERVPKYAGAFRDATMKQLSQFVWVPRATATEVVAEAMKPSIRFSREQCVDLPPAIYQTREVPMTSEQSAAYEDMRRKLLMEYQQDQVLAVNEAVKMSKLLQIGCGVAYAKDGHEVVLPCEPRIQATVEAVEEAGTKTIVFVPFRAVLHHVAAQLGKRFSVASVSGETSKNERDKIFHDFQTQAAPQVLVAQPAAMSHGLTLTAASTIVWYGPVTSNEIYEQANARVSRPGQKHTQFIVNIESSPVERRTYARLKNKQALQGLLLETLKDVT